MRTDPARLAARPEVRAIRNLLDKPEKSLADYHAVGEQMRRLAAEEAVTGAAGGQALKTIRVQRTPARHE